MGHPKAWEGINPALLRTTIAMDAEELFDVIIPAETESGWVTVRDSYNQIVFSIESRHGESSLRLAELRRMLIEILNDGGSEIEDLDLDAHLDVIANDWNWNHYKPKPKDSHRERA